MPRHAFSNNAVTTLAAGVSNTATTITLTSASAFSAVIYDDPVQALTITDPANIQPPEIVYATQIPDTNQRTVVRGREGTTARTWSSGAIVSARVTAGMLQSFAQVSDGALSISENGPRGRNWVGDKAVQTGGFPVLQVSKVLPGAGSGFLDPNVSREIVGGTLPFHLGAIPAWGADTTYYPFTTVGPAAPTGMQYCFHPATGLGQTANTATQPAFGSGVVPAQNGAAEVGLWVPINREGMLIGDSPSYFPDNCSLILTEVGFYCYEVVGGTAPVVSIGDADNPARFASSVALTQISGSGHTHRIPITTGGAAVTGGIAFACETPSSGTFWGRFYWKGFFISFAG